jgi:Tol biopolymer transport system component
MMTTSPSGACTSVLRAGARVLESRLITLGALAVVLLLVAPTRSDAQYFGRNKVQYQNFDFKVLKTEHFDIHYYPEEELAVRDAARMAERWYVRLSRIFGHQFRERKPIVLYADQGDFQQTNTISSMVGEGTGGVTEALKNRVILPFNGSFADFDHVLGHELVHAFQYDMAGTPRGNGLESLGQLPLWFIEGLAEYLSVGREDPHTALWLRDAVLRDDVPTLDELSGNYRYFPYRYGQAVWAYIGGRFGDARIGDLFRRALQVGLKGSFQRALGISDSAFSRDWIAAVKGQYGPLIGDRAKPADIGRRIVAGDGDLNISPVVSPDGKWIAFFSSRGIFSIDLYIADARTGDIEKRLATAGNGPHSDALRFINSAGTWSPDGKRFAYVLFAEGDDQLSIVGVDGGDDADLRVEGVGAITNPSWSPDGTQIVFSGVAGGISDLYLVEVATSKVRRLTNDKHTDLQPTWSPDSRTIAFVTDRGAGTNFARLSYDELRLATVDVASGTVTPLQIFSKGRQNNPQYSPDGRELFFISDYDGFTEIYRHVLGTTDVFRVTRTASGISGITATSPAMSVARNDGSVYFSVFENNTYSIHMLEASAARGEAVNAVEALGVAGTLPPATGADSGIVETYLDDPLGGLPGPTTYELSEYSPSLQLDYIGTPTVGVALDSYGGAGVGGGIFGLFSDMLGNHTVGVELSIQGSIQDLGAQVQYINRSNRWNWAVSAGHVPYMQGAQAVTQSDTTINGTTYPTLVYEQILQRTYVDAVDGMAIYPFSITNRFEAGVGYTHLGYDYDYTREVVIPEGTVGFQESDIDGPEGVHMIQPQVAFVGDYSFFGFTSPVAGARYRAEMGGTFGTLTFGTLLLDYRHYFFANPITFALRGLGYGRFGDDAESDRISPLYIGREAFVRGYSVSDFSNDECFGGNGDCPQFDRLLGSRMAVTNAELRIPVFGNEDLGLLNFPYLPLEITGFFDAGVAWSSFESPDIRFDRNTTDRVPVMSAGISARANILGYLVLEVFYAYPFQRYRVNAAGEFEPRGWHFGWQISPGW